MKPITPLLAVTAVASALLTDAGHAANIATTTANPMTTTVLVSTGNYFQLDGAAPATFNINSGGTLSVAAPQFETIIGQNWAGTTTLNLNTGGTMDFSGATGAGTTFYLGNSGTQSPTGILNVLGGTFNGSGLTTSVFGRGTGTGQMNISAGTVSFGALPSFVTANSFINFTTGSTGTLTITGANQATYESLFATQDLRFNGSFAGNFSDNFVVNGSTLSVVPEPSALLLGALGLLPLLRRRR